MSIEMSFLLVLSVKVSSQLMYKMYKSYIVEKSWTMCVRLVHKAFSNLSEYILFLVDLLCLDTLPSSGQKGHN